MVFSSIVFLLYFLPILLVMYFLLPKKFKNIFLLLASIGFYAWGAPKFIFVILLTTIIDFYLVSVMDKSNNDNKRKLLLVFSVSINLGLLIYFKYSNFFIENVNATLSVFGLGEIHWTKLILPIGISFYTFETITYVVDVYRRVHKPLKSFWDYQLYIILFPKLIAGPIIRYHEIADQIKERRDVIDDKLVGFYRFAFGLGKKVLIANQLGVFADSVFNSNYADLDCITAWVGSLAYTFQIYFDFSGYSDMAIGLAKMLGFKFPENFNNPYISQSITEFWRRWHITLGSWMRNYLYIPLGGNRTSTTRMYINLWLVFLASGLWHGASWSFVLWGAYHGLFIVLERAFLTKLLLKIGKLPSILITFCIINIGWVFFRVENINNAFAYIKTLFSFHFISHLQFDRELIVTFILAILFSFFAANHLGQKLQNKFYDDLYSNRRHSLVSIVSMALFILSVCYITSDGFNPFIYFRF